MAADFWAAHYAELRAKGQTIEAEDDDFDLDDILARAESGDWEDL